jgi:uncharacterized protein YfaS (alpha-2-macroglobulin family)
MNASSAAPDDEGRNRLQAKLLRGQNNWKDAYEIFRKLAVEPSTNPQKVADDLNEAIQCLLRLRRQEETDDLIREAVAAQPSNSRLLYQAAKCLQSLNSHGLVSDNKFHRAPQNRDSGAWVNVGELDRNQALRWMVHSEDLASKSDMRPDATAFYRDWANYILSSREGRRAWQLQIQTDLDENLNYADVENADRSIERFAPVDQENQPILHKLPTSWSEAATDGERLRWVVGKWSETEPLAAKLFWADFLNSQFGVATLAADRWFHRFQSDSNDKKSSDDSKSGVFMLHTLEDGEAVARLASGIRRFALPAEFNPLILYRELIDKYQNKDAYWRLINEYNNRRRYPQAAELCRRALQHFPGDEQLKNTLDAIILPRCRFDEVDSQPAGRPASIEMIYRNAKQAEFTAHRVDTEKLFTDVKNAFRDLSPDGSPAFGGHKNRYPPSIEQPNELFNDTELSEYIAGKQAEWKLDLQTPANHWERRLSVATPLQKAGLYVVTVKLDGSGFTTRCLVWINDTAIVRKQLDQTVLYHVADAVTGLPRAGADIEFFGFAYEYSQQGRPRAPRIANFAKKTDADGRVLLSQKDIDNNMQWMVAARSSDGGFAPLGFDSVWFGNLFRQSFQQLKAYGVADRPAYRPGDSVKAKFWVGLANYGDTNEGTTKLAVQAGRTFQVKLIDPQGTNLWQGSIEVDRYGGGAVEFSIPKDAKLGLYRFVVDEGNVQTDLSIRVEEYRKPEFEVFIDAPTDPIQLGDKFQAKVRAKYYFGTPVAGAKAAIKVMRSAFDDKYYPIRPFDWCYGPGYWWTSYDTPWYPGWSTWRGCYQPTPWWFPFTPEEPPELVYETEATLDEAGEAMVEIDSSIAKAFQADQDHRYRIEVDVRDASRRTISSSGQVVAARAAFKIYNWLHRGYYSTGDKVDVHFQAKTLGGKPVPSQGKLELLRISYNEEREPLESFVTSWEVKTDAEGELEHSLEAGRAGQYRLKLILNDAAGHAVEGGSLLTIRGSDAKGGDFRYSALELIPEKSEYRPGETLKLQINTDRDDALVALFIRPENGTYPEPKWVRLQAKSSSFEIPVTRADQPNFFVEAYTIYEGKFHQEAREIFVPPEERVLEVDLKSNKPEYLPGEEAEVSVEVRGLDGTSIESSSVLAVYDRALEQIAPDAIPPDIREFFWKWRRSHYPQSRENLSLHSQPIHVKKMPNAFPLGMFGSSMADDSEASSDKLFGARRFNFNRGMLGEAFRGAVDEAMPMAAAAPMEAADGAPMMKATRRLEEVGKMEAAAGEGGQAPAEPPKVRKDFADAAYWQADLRSDGSGKSIAKFKMPEHLASWQIAVWSMSDGLRVGSEKLQAVTRKNLMVRLQTPRFLVDRDQVVASALINNEFPDPIEVTVELQQAGDFIEIEGASPIVGEANPLSSPGLPGESGKDDDANRLPSPGLPGEGPGVRALPEASAPPQFRTSSSRKITIPAHSQKRVDWNCRAIRTGEAVLRVMAISVRESDAMQLKLPIVVNGILKTESYVGTIRPNQSHSKIEFTVPEARIEDQSKLTVRVSPSLAMAMIDALPFLVDYPHGCTEQTLNRFVPTVITQRTLQRLGIDLESLQAERNNLNAQEIGDPSKRRERWKQNDRNPVYDKAEVSKMVEVGLRRLTEMQNSDGGWGWFSGRGEQSWPHTTAVVVRGLLTAKAADAAIVPDCLDRGLDWLANHQTEQIGMLNHAATKTRPYKERPDDLDALIFHILVDADRPSPEMQRYLFSKRENLSVFSKALVAWAVHKLGDAEQTAMLRQNIEQFLVQDAENETAYLQDESPWWYWYGSSIESTAAYLKLLCKMEPQGTIAPRLVKYLLNNRRHATYWNSTRDTAMVVEAFADFLQATGEGSGEMTVDVHLDGASIGKIAFTPKTLFSVNNTLELMGADIKPGRHTLEILREGQGAIYWNAYQTNFTLEDEIAPAGLEVKIDRRYYRLDPVKKDLLKASDRGRIEEGKRAGFDRVPIQDLTEVKSGSLIEVELIVDSKNDYEYLLIQDPKAASLEPVESQSGYAFNRGLTLYQEFRDRRVDLFLRWLPRGNHAIVYRARCEAPGRFTALPAVASGMYAPELVGNSSDFDFVIVDE